MEAARAQFGDKGFEATTVRGIARTAGVDPALVHHFFGGKRQIFIAALRLPFDPGEMVDRVLAESGGDPAGGMIRFMLDVWDSPETRPSLLALLRSAATHEDSAALLSDFMHRVMFELVARRLGVSRLRVSLLASQLFGMVLIRYVIGVEPLASATHEDVVAQYAPALRAVIEGADRS